MTPRAASPRSGAVGFAVVGAGLVGPRHAEFATKAEGARLAVVCDLREDRGRPVAEKLGAEWTPRLSEVLGREDVHVVSVCLPTALHLEVATAAAEAGKHVIVEKPLELNVARARKLIAACKRNNVRLAAIFNRRFVYGTKRTREAVQSGELGKLLVADMRFKAWRPQSYYSESGWRGTWDKEGGAALINQGIHGVDLITWIAGPIARVYGHARHLRHDIEADDTTVAVCEYESGALGVIECTTSVTPRQGDWLEVHGEKGSVLLENYRIHAWQIEGSEAGEPHPEDLMLPGADKGVDVGHFLQVQDMADAVREGRDPVVTGEAALHSLAVVQAIYESERRKAPVDVAEILASR
ncbi:MAG TPA: Gfo/Idh/MocA family oxidoreductase [Chloroflexota bacterium]|nr:Gfo/Idh/MocA family oxidoreductase [Chloroflexota bacterium]